MLHVLAEAAVRSLLLAAVWWTLLNLFAVRHPRAQSVGWTVILLAALTMPALMQWALIPTPAPGFTWAGPIELNVAPAGRSFDWWSAAVTGYWVAAIVLLVRQLAGIARSAMILRRSAPVRESWTRGVNVRASHEIAAPVTVASTILLPGEYGAWSKAKRQAVLAHERTHVRNCDFYVQVLAQLYRALFWFSPLAWWLPGRLALLSEQSSDDAALRRLRDRTAYAEILLEFACMPVAAPGVAIARPAHVAGRIDRILMQREPSKPLAAAHQVALACALLPLILVSACRPSDSGGESIQGRDLQPHAAGAVAAASSTEETLPDAVEPKSNPRYPLSQPVYPAPSRRARQSGTVVLRLHVLEDGSVDDVRIKRSSGFARLDYSAANTAFDWRLDPGTTRGEPVPMWGEFAVTFKLTD